MSVQRSGTGNGLSAAVERLSEHAAEWGPHRLLDEGLDLIRDSTWADVSVLHAVERGRVREVARRPDRGSAKSGDPMAAVPEWFAQSWFPWGLAPVHATRFVLVDDATSLPTGPGAAPTIGDLGMRSCVHLPILERSRPVGAVHLYWVEPRLAWDDGHGALLRTLARYLLSAAPL